MSRTWIVYLVHLKPALELAAELMIKAGYPPNTEKGRLIWENEKNSDHRCGICFTAYRGLYWTAYIRVNAYDCNNKNFQNIIRNFGRELSRRKWLETLDHLLFNSTGSAF